ncbi:MAG: phosphohydrolase [Elusimicrobia bacterium]|nr:phosphohydrolase [Elusimicrobiota bacterium]
MDVKCPGSDPRLLKVEIHKCPECGYEVEIFSDEIKVLCPKCRKTVYREKTPSCIDWCKHARQCLGEIRWQELKKRMDEMDEKK